MQRNNTSYKSENVTMINSSGEIISEGTLNFKETKKNGREKGFFSIYNDEFNKIENLSNKEFKVLIYCVNNRNQKTNIVNLGRKDILKKLQMDRSNFFRYKNNLIKQGFIIETETKNQFLINPRFCCSADAETYMKLRLSYANYKSDQEELKRVKDEIKNSKNKDNLQKIFKLIDDNVINTNDIFEFIKILTNEK